MKNKAIFILFITLPVIYKSVYAGNNRYFKNELKKSVTLLRASVFNFRYGYIPTYSSNNFYKYTRGINLRVYPHKSLFSINLFFELGTGDSILERTDEEKYYIINQRTKTYGGIGASYRFPSRIPFIKWLTPGVVVDFIYLSSRTQVYYKFENLLILTDSDADGFGFSVGAELEVEMIENLFSITPGTSIQFLSLNRRIWPLNNENSYTEEFKETEIVFSLNFSFYFFKIGG